jgi:hypothetical protein
MPTYALSPIFDPQYAASGAAAALVFATPGGGTVVPANLAIQIAVLRVANNSNAPVTLALWRVPAGGAQGVATVVVPTITVPVASNTFPQFDATACWGMVLQAGDAIWALAGTGSALVVQADGTIITP